MRTYSKDIATTAILLAVVLAGCGTPSRSVDFNGSSATAGADLTTSATALSGPASGTTPTEPSRVANPPTQASRVVKFRFDDLGGGDPIIQVYPGVTRSAADLIQNGSFNSGDEVVALCKVDGRLVKSSTSSGERQRESSTWVKINGTSGETQYATLTYGQVLPSIDSLPNC